MLIGFVMGFAAGVVAILVVAFAQGVARDRHVGRILRAWGKVERDRESHRAMTDSERQELMAEQTEAQDHRDMTALELRRHLQTEHKERVEIPVEIRVETHEADGRVIPYRPVSPLPLSMMPGETVSVMMVPEEEGERSPVARPEGRGYGGQAGEVP